MKGKLELVMHGLKLNRKLTRGKMNHVKSSMGRFRLLRGRG
ncbi:hypothetical protein LM600581_340003 [Listeria monocytogenes]|nr:hypothetical protein LM1000505_200008 [Listeria monocytogenes]CUK63145.1 hypothetical protein LM600581_340003 [Listeria monocytogenes]CUK73298.1 hypothetical protein LM601023_70220 [Listeria monocytogenes]CUL96755.1 hypothetical protein LM900372_150032 [Listeria monocytogenes]